MGQNQSVALATQYHGKIFHKILGEGKNIGGDFPFFNFPMKTPKKALVNKIPQKSFFLNLGRIWGQIHLSTKAESTDFDSSVWKNVWLNFLLTVHIFILINATLVIP